MKYPKPRILLVDMPSECGKELTNSGYNAKAGTFGVRYRVPPSDSLAHVSLNARSLPDYEEQEIIIVNTRDGGVSNRNSGNAPYGVSVFWQHAGRGIVDPRPPVMAGTSGAFDRIFGTGGIFVVFLDTPYEVEYGIDSLTHYRGPSLTRTPVKLSNRSFLPALDELILSDNSGNEIRFSAEHAIGKLLKRVSEDASYHCTIDRARIALTTRLLAANKFGDCVGAIVDAPIGSGKLIVLPRMPSFHRIIVEFIETCCAQWNPALFPFHEAGNWVHRDEYELERVVELQTEAKRVRAEAKKQVEEIQTEINRLRTENSDHYILMTGTGDELVQTVIRTLSKLGFTRVVDVDEQARERGEDAFLGEDIQILDKKPALIIDVKGVNGHPEDAEATQSEKHALMRAKEFEGNVKPLTIINHQRNLPPHDRDQQAYRSEIIENAKQTDLGLMTTWELLLLLRNKARLNWPADSVKPVFYRTGRIEPIPEHYCELGRIVEVWKVAFGLVPTQGIKVGDRLAIEAGDFFVEANITSLHVNDKNVQSANAGSDCGIKCDVPVEKAKKGRRVFLILAQ